MNRNGGFWPLATTIALVVAAAFAADRYLALATAQDGLSARMAELTEARQVVQANRDAFDGGVGVAGGDLKSLVQQAGVRGGVRIAYLAEDDREVDPGIRDRNVIVRATNVPHGQWVRFLAELQGIGGGRVKEIRVKPSKDQNGAYQEAEAVLTVRRVVALAGKPAK